MRGRRTEQQMAARVWRACLVDGAPDAARFRLAVDLMLEQRPRGWHGMLRELLRRFRLEQARRTAEVECAVALAPETQAALSAWLRRRCPSVTAVRFRENPALIGGVCIQAGSEVIDDSVSGRLAAIRQQFSQPR